MPLRLFRSRNVAGANAVQMLTVAGMFAMFFLGALYLQEILGYSPLGVGIAFLPATLITGTLSLRFSEKLNMRFGPKTTLIPGLVAMGAGLLLFARAPVDGNYVTDILPVMILLGVGGGVAFPALMMLAMSGATQEDSGLASGLVNTSMQVGGAIGLAVLATLAASTTDSKLAEGASENAALNSGFHLAYVVGAGLVLAALDHGRDRDPGGEDALARGDGRDGRCGWHPRRRRLGLRPPRAGVRRISLSESN